MSNNKQNLKSSTAFAFDESTFRVIKLEDTPAGYRLAWKHSADISVLDEFLQGKAAKEIASANVATAVSIDQKAVTYYNIEVPSVSSDKLDSLVRMQAESILPLPIGQMQFDYLCGNGIAGKTRVTIAAARSEKLKKYLPLIKRCNADSILLNCQGIVKAFDTLFDIPQQKYVIVNIGDTATQVLVSDNGQLAGAARIEAGCENLTSPELFLHDLRGLLEFFNADKSNETGIYVFSKSEQLNIDIAEALSNAGLNATHARLQTSMIASDEPLSPSDIAEYLDCIAAAMLAMKPDEKKLDLFSGLMVKDRPQKKNSPLSSLAKSAVLFVTMLIASFFILNTVNRTELESLDDERIDKLVSEQRVRKLIAQQRPDILELLTIINDDAPSGTLINSISFKKGEPVTIISEASSLEEIDKLKLFISGKKGVSDVRNQNPSYNEKTKKYSFSINFDYKDWATKKLR